VAESTLVTGIGELVTNDPAFGDGSPLGIVRDAALVTENGAVTWVGPAVEAIGDAGAADERVDVEGAAVVPGFVDSHTHLVFAGERSAEFSARMAGEPYTGGGIATTVAATRAASDEELRDHTSRLMDEIASLGTTTVEIKSGYGLNVTDEARILRIAREFTAETTFLGAHVVPPDYAHDRAAYLDLVRGPMLDACRPYAKWVDVFCDRGAFDAEETRSVLRAGVAAGLMPRLHGNQLEAGPGAQIAVEFAAASVDHCTYLTDHDVSALAGSQVVATLLPAAEFSTRSPYPDARRLLDAGVVVAIATDCNPGSSFVTSMPLCMALAVREMRMSPAEALLAATRGGARALRRDDVGRLSPGASADLVVLAAPSYAHLAYRPGSPLVARTWVRGAEVFRRS
jgi:imidazolonepropionase